MARKPRTSAGPVPSTDLTLSTGVGIPAAVPSLQELNVILTPLEETFARLFVLYCNATRAYLEASPGYTGNRAAARVRAWEISNRPHVLQRIRAYESAAAKACVIDYAAILEHDRQIVEGHKHADEIMQHVWQCCRYCHGEGFNYQWIDLAEFWASVKAVDEENTNRVERKLPRKPLPTDDGGYGYLPSNDPNILCPKCEGRGVGVTILADTTKLGGPARAIVKGLKIKADGSTEVLFHDVDKAKERLLRAGGIFGDDAASVARGAAAGAAAGATAAVAAAAAAKDMTAEQAQRLYLELG